MDAILVSPHQLAQLEEHLLLVRRILREPAPPLRQRGWLLEQCRRRGDDERELWRALARYRQTGAAGLLTANWRRQTTFGRQDALARERLLPLLLDTPPGMLDEFGLLAQLLQELGDRLAFLCSWLLEFFLDPQTPRHSDADHLEVALVRAVDGLPRTCESAQIGVRRMLMKRHDLPCSGRLAVT